jgi:hypothetical protein
MRKAIVGIAAVLALTTTTASAGDAKRIEKVASDTSARADSSRKSKGMIETVSKSSDVRVAQASTDSSKTRAIDVNGSPADRWLVEREGYRDGGY